MRVSVAALVGFIVVTTLVAFGVAAGVDRPIHDAAQPIASASLDVFASALSLLGRTDIALLIALVAGAILLWRGRAEGLVALLIPVVLAADNLVKTLVARPRPPAGAGHSVELLPQLLAKSTETFAFPSSHVALVAFLAVVLGAALPKWRPLLWALVVLVALTRIYLNKHWFTDVVAGALLGVLLAELSLLLVTRVTHLWTARRRSRVAV